MLPIAPRRCSVVLLLLLVCGSMPSVLAQGVPDIIMNMEEVFEESIMPPTREPSISFTPPGVPPPAPPTTSIQIIAFPDPFATRAPITEGPPYTRPPVVAPPTPPVPRPTPAPVLTTPSPVTPAPVAFTPAPATVTPAPATVTPAPAAVLPTTPAPAGTDQPSSSTVPSSVPTSTGPTSTPPSIITIPTATPSIAGTTPTPTPSGMGTGQPAAPGTIPVMGRSCFALASTPGPMSSRTVINDFNDEFAGFLAVYLDDSTGIILSNIRAELDEGSQEFFNSNSGRVRRLQRNLGILEVCVDVSGLATMPVDDLDNALAQTIREQPGDLVRALKTANSPETVAFFANLVAIQDEYRPPTMAPTRFVREPGDAPANLGVIFGSVVGGVIGCCALYILYYRWRQPPYEALADAAAAENAAKQAAYPPPDASSDETSTLGKGTVDSSDHDPGTDENYSESSSSEDSSSSSSSSSSEEEEGTSESGTTESDSVVPVSTSLLATGTAGAAAAAAAEKKEDIEEDINVEAEDDDEDDDDDDAVGGGQEGRSYAEPAVITDNASYSYSLDGGNTSLPAGGLAAMATATAAAAAADAAADIPQDMSDETSKRSNMVTREVDAPPGKLGIVIDTTLEGPVIHKVNATSPLDGLLFPGDIIIGIDDIDTRAMSASAITALMVKTANKRRRLKVMAEDAQ